MNLTRNDKILLSLFLALGVAVFFLGRWSKSTPEVIQKPDHSREYKIIDSIQKNEQANRDTITIERKIKVYQAFRVDSLSTALKSNHKTTNNAVKATQNFTPNSRKHWMDSVEIANELNK